MAGASNNTGPQGKDALQSKVSKVKRFSKTWKNGKQGGRFSDNIDLATIDYGE
jgi:hypothetical protein